MSIAIGAILLATTSLADDAPSSTPKSSEKPVRRLKGEFKGHAVGTSPDSSSDSADTPAKTSGEPAATSSSSSTKPLVLDNRMVQGSGSTRKTKEPASASRPQPRPPATSAVAQPKSSTVSPATAPAPKTSSPATPFSPVDLNGNGEAYWRARARQSRERLERAKHALEVAQLDEKREENDFYAWDDGQYRDNVIKPAWDKSKEETLRAQDEVTAAQKAADDLEDDARKAGAYPGWIRE